jgi:hypothetical protein
VYAATADLFTANALVDDIDGGAGTDSIVISNNAGATFTIAVTDNFETITLVEQIIATPTDQIISITLHEDAVTDGIVTVDLSGDTTANGANVINASAIAGTTGMTLTGSAGADTITGTDNNDIITAGSGIDVITGGGGNDTIILSADTVADTVKIAWGGEGVDTINAFEVGSGGDVIDFTGTLDVNDVTGGDLDVDGFLLYAADANHVLVDGLTIFSGAAFKAIDAGDYLTEAEIATFLTGFGTARDATVGSAADVAYIIVEGDAGNSTLARVTGGADTAIDEADVTIIAHLTSRESEDFLAGNFADFA